VVDAKTSATLASFGKFKGDGVNLTHLGENNRAALQLMDRAGWR
jgi:iron(III) transport system substrate-binding protein